jgi:hypothetical protein
MPERSLRVRYFGVPLITKRLSALDCDALIAKAAGRIDSKLVRHLSFAGRLQLITSVLFSLQVFWARVFIIPKRLSSYLNRNSIDFCGVVMILKLRLRFLGSGCVFLKLKVGLVLKGLRFGTMLLCSVRYGVFLHNQDHFGLLG